MNLWIGGILKLLEHEPIVTKFVENFMRLGQGTCTIQEARMLQQHYNIQE